MKSLVALAAAAFVSIAASASPSKVDVQVASLELKNGKVLPAATIKTFDHETGNVVILSDRSISSVQLELLPDDLAHQVMALVPPEAKAIARDDRLARETEKRIAAAKAEAAARKREFDRKDRSGAAQLELAAQREREKMDYLKATARTRADRYFRYDFIHGGSTYVFSTDLEVEEPEPVMGWYGRYRVRGHAGIRYYVSKGSSLNTTTRDFEVMLQEDGKGNLKTVDFTCD